MRQTFVLTFDPTTMDFSVSSNSIKMKRNIGFDEAIGSIATTLKTEYGLDTPPEVEKYVIIKAAEEQPAEAQPTLPDADSPEGLPTADPAAPVEPDKEPEKDLGAALPIPEPDPPVVADPKIIEPAKEVVAVTV